MPAIWEPVVMLISSNPEAFPPANTCCLSKTLSYLSLLIGKSGRIEKMTRETIAELYEVLTAMAAGASLAIYLMICWNI